MKTPAIWIALMCSLQLTAEPPGIDELRRMSSRFAPVAIQVDLSALSKSDRAALKPLVEAAYLIDHLFLGQYWSGNLVLHDRLKADKTPLGRMRFAWFWLNKGPWSALDEHTAFLPNVPAKKLPGANFYPEDMEKAEFEKWAASLNDAQREAAQGFFTTIRRSSGKLIARPFSEEYAADLKRLAALLKEAAAATQNESLRRFLTLRAAAFLSNDYYASDVAWMDLDAPIDVTIGPYETYNDELFGYKASFEAYINLRDDEETKKVNFFSSHLQEIEDNLPVDPKFRNAKIGATAPIRVVNQIIAAGDAAHGVRTAAYNLPNDERVVREKGSKRVMLRNVQQAKFERILSPIADRLLTPEARRDLSFDSFFTHILAHELTHGIGPHQLRVNGRATTPRQELKELYSAIEEAKADVSGLFMLQHMFDRKLLPDHGPAAERKLYTSFLASSFRTLRFGLHEAHGRGMALQFRYLQQRGAFVPAANGTFTVDLARIKKTVRDLAGELLTIEATGDYSRARRMLDESATLTPELKAALTRLEDLPVDINPDDVTATSIAPRRN